MSFIQAPSSGRSSSGAPLKQAKADQLPRLFDEVASLVLQHGITLKVLCKIMERSLVQTTAARSKLRNGRVNYSRVAAQTGISRTSIRRLLDDATLSSDLADRTPLARIVNGWRSDREFVDTSGKPKPLQKASFARLVRKYGGDIPPRAMLEELRRAGVVLDAADGWVRLSRVRGPNHDLGNLKLLLRAISRFNRTTINKRRALDQ